MARPRSSAAGQNWMETLGEQIGAALGRAIADSVHKAVRESVDVPGLARELSAKAGRKPGRMAAAAGKKRRGRPASGAVCSEDGCGKPAIAKGLCRSHYYRARYRRLKGKSAARSSRKKAS